MRRPMMAVVLACVPAVGVAATGVERISWMQGCWSFTADGRTVEEQWMSPGGGAMLGTSRTVKDRRLVEYEFIIVRERGDSLVYLALPSGQVSAEFVSTSVDSSSVVFENAQHDFPQRIGYRRRGARLDAWVEGNSGGKSRRIEFPYQRVACPGE
jgi:hypothetical protein